MDFKEASGSLASSSATANNNVVQLDLTGYAGVSLQLTGTWVATIQFEGSADGVTFVALNLTPTNSTTAATSATSNKTWQGACAGLKLVRARVSAYTSGTAVATLVATISSPGGSGGGGGGGGGTSSNFADSFPTPGTAVGFIGSTGNMTGATLDASGYLKVNVAAGGGAAALPSTATLSTVATDAASHLALASNANRLGGVFFNKSAVGVTLKAGTTASGSSLSAYLLPMQQGSLTDLFGGLYTGRIDAISDAADAVTANAGLYVTELTA